MLLSLFSLDTYCPGVPSAKAGRPQDEQALGYGAAFVGKLGDVAWPGIRADQFGSRAAGSTDLCRSGRDNCGSGANVSRRYPGRGKRRDRNGATGGVLGTSFGQQDRDSRSEQGVRVVRLSSITRLRSQLHSRHVTWRDHIGGFDLRDARWDCDQRTNLRTGRTPED